MIIWAIIATAAVIIVTGIWIAYRRQVKKTCDQLAFLKEHKTNLRLTGDLPFSELNELIDGINEVIDKSREVRQASQQSENSLKETITNLSHDIRTPLTSMDGYFQLLAQADSEEERAHYISVIQSRIASLKNILEELFTYTKLQNENYELALEPMDFGKCVYDTVLAFYNEFSEKGIEPTVNFCDKCLFINGNDEAVRRILQNIVKNALEHGHSQIALEMLKQDGDVIFRCSNDVQCPDEIDINQIFIRFYKADSARNHASTGLGLSIAKGLTERLNGTISAKLDHSVFSVEIRFSTLAESKAPMKAAGQKSILYSK